MMIKNRMPDNRHIKSLLILNFPNNIGNKEATRHNIPILITPLSRKECLLSSEAVINAVKPINIPEIEANPINIS